ncbi:zinc-dependent metalloprotease [Chryseobacterium viscerum]|uniref:T9SS C-terminal target domain-containing protein n=1 Tax=Chryseobacterium viscerum TaxID=1037377 RepID=A0A316WG51_9FLAO|nr:zinc-dependent metalloprotease [Chryseobacterium viscerum]PWN57988.1 T9SS C-terminal target domain-containing protein [Chryseobacterium viscerum]
MKYKLILILLIVFNYFRAQDISKGESLPGRVFRFDFERFESQFKKKRLQKEKITPIFINLPTEDGRNIRFTLNENNLTVQRLESILTFDGVSDDKSSSLKLSVFKDHFNAIIKTNAGYFFIEPYKTALGTYRIYNASSSFGESFICRVEENNDVIKEFETAKKSLVSKSMPNFPFGSQIRKFRMAVAATGEFTQAFNGNADDALAEVVNIINLINKIYESEVSVTFSLIAETTNKSLIFTNGTTDPFTVDPNFANAGNSQIGFNTLNNNMILPYDKYDIGHTFNILSIGAAQGTAGPKPCINNSKARAWSEWSLTVPKGSIARVIAHEIGHQFSAGHTYNAVGGNPGDPTFCTSGWNSASAIEPGSGSTLMSYGNNCSVPYDQVNTGNNRLSYFNVKSLDQILATLQSSVTCYTLVNSNNLAPSANAGVDITIPKNTPFKLKGIGSDPSDNNISYTWEQADLATLSDKGALGSAIVGAGGYSAVNSTTAPLFRSEQSSSTQERYFPKMQFVLNNENNPPTNDGEALPLVPRTMKFRFTVRDNNFINGGLDSDEIIVTVNDTGPLNVTHPNANGFSVASNANITVTWDVNNTNTIKNNVDVLLSADGGLTFPYTLASNVVNSGSSNVMIPYIPSTNKARIKVVGIINPYAEFFDVSDNNFTIISDCNAYKSYIIPKTDVRAIAGSTSSNLNMSAPDPADYSYTSKTIMYNVGTSTNNIIIYSNSSMTSPYSVNSSLSHLFRFRVTESGSYVFSKSSGFLLISVHSGNPASVNNFLTSNTYYNGLSYSYIGSTKAVALNEGVDYYFIISNFSTPASAASYTLTSTGPGRLYETSAVPTGYSYTFAAINTETGKIQAVSPTADFTALPAGTYTVHGISYISTANVSTFVGKSITELISLNICFNESVNSRTLILTSGINITDNSQTGIGIKIYPNPVKDVLFIMTDQEISQYEVYDMAGRNITGRKKYSGSISFQEYATGCYVLRLFDKQGLIHQETVIKK